jgi:class 3 adenylate cyclase
VEPIGLWETRLVDADSVAALLTRARSSFEAKDWLDAVDAFEEAGGFEGLNLSDIERLAWARLWMLAPATECLDAFERLEAAAVREGDRKMAGRAAFEQARMHGMLENTSVSESCWARGVSHLGDEECAETALGLALAALGYSVGGDSETAAVMAEDAIAAAQRVGEPTAEAVGVYILGVAACNRGDVEAGLEHLGRAMGMATAGEVHPLYAGVITCGGVYMCRLLGDWERAREWNEVADRYCARESICHFPGHCSVYRSELTREAGDFENAALQAMEAMVQAGDWSRSWLGLAYHQLGEAELCAGKLDDARAAFARAVENGSDPQPGQARLLAAEGHHDAAIRQIERFVEHVGYLNDHVLPVLAAGVTIALTADRLDVARRLGSELDAMLERTGTPAVSAAATQARGEIAVAEGDARQATELLRDSVRQWGRLKSPYHAARARVALAAALDELDHDAEASLERDAAAGLFERLGAEFDLRALRPSPHEEVVRERRTFSFTDIVGSSELVAALGDESWGRMLNAHDRHLRELLAEFGGTEVKHEGDGLFVSFESESDAVAWAVAVQQRLDRQRIEHGFAPEIRIGVHCGEAIRYGEDYIGRCVHETARIANAAGAGEIYVSAHVSELLGDELKVSAMHVLDLKGFSAPHTVAEIDWSP